MAPLGFQVEAAPIANLPECLRGEVIEGASEAGPPDPVIIQVHGLAGARCQPSSLELHSQRPSSFRRLWADVVGEAATSTGLEDAALKLLFGLQAYASKGGSLVFLAHDLGGSILKMALVLAAKDPSYRGILDKTCCLVFFETPHRSSHDNSWPTLLLGVLESRYSGRLGHWLPKALGQLSSQHEGLASEFDALPETFRIISHYRDPRYMPDDLWFMPKECATLGLANEERVGVDQPYGCPCEYMPQSEVTQLGRQLRDATMAQWKPYRAFLRLLSHHELEPRQEPLPFEQYCHLAASLLEMPRVAEWISLRRQPDTILRLALGRSLSPAGVLNALGKSLRAHSPSHQCVLLVSGTEPPKLGPTDEAQVYSALIRQFLQQEPRLYLAIRHLQPILLDSVASQSRQWRSRTLWRCLKTLLHAPRQTQSYCLIYADASSLQAEVLRRVILAAQRTEIPLRIIAAAERFSHVPLESSPCFDLDLKAAEFAEYIRKDLGELATAAALKQPSQLLVAACDALVDKLSSSTDYRQSEIFLRMGIPRALDADISRIWTACATPDAAVAIRLAGNEYGPFITRAVFWVAHATEPLSIPELDAILAFECTRRPGNPWPSAHGSIANLPDILPGVVQIYSGRLALCGGLPAQTLDELFRTTLQGHSVACPSADTYIAHVCLEYLMGHVWKPPMALDHKQTMARYAARHWLCHYRRAGPCPPDDPLYSAFASDDANVDRWIDLLEFILPEAGRQYGKGKGEGGENNQRPDGKQLRGRLHIDSFRMLEVCQWLYLGRSSEAVLDRLLVIASERTDRELLLALCMDLATFDKQAVIRAVGTMPWELGEGVMAKADVFGDPQEKADAYLTAVALGNTKAADGIFAQLVSQPPPMCFSRALQIACDFDDAAAAESILDDEGAWGPMVREANLKDSGWTVVHSAAQSGHDSIVARLGELDVRMDTPTAEAETRPLLIAVSHGFTQLVHTMLSYTGKVDRNLNLLPADGPGTSPLHVASRYGFYSLVRLLVSNGADAGARDANLDLPLHLSLRNGHRRTSSYLLTQLRAAPSNVEDGEMPVDIVSPDIGHGDIGVFDRPLSRSFLDDWGVYAEIQAGDDAISTTGGAARRGSVAGAGPGPGPGAPDAASLDSPVNAVNRGGMTMLMEAVKHDRHDGAFVRALVDKGALLSLSPDDKPTALHLAAQRGSVSLVRYLADKGASVDGACLKNGFTPLHYACYWGRAEAAEELLGRDASLSATDSSGRTPFVAACRSGQVHMVKLLLLRAAPAGDGERQRATVEAVRQSRTMVVELLLDSGCDANARDMQGYYKDSLLHIAASNGHAGLLQLLLLRGARHDAVDTKGGPPLFDAIWSDVVDSARMLLEAGANPDAERETDETPLSIAISSNRAQVVRMLLQRGAKLRRPPSWTMCENNLELALGQSSTKVAIVLVEAYTRSASAGGGGGGVAPDGCTAAKALRLAVKYHCLPLLRPILDEWGGANDLIDPDDDNNDGIDGDGTALHFAASRGELEAMEVILEAKTTDANRVAGRHGTALQAAVLANDKQLEMVRMLLDRGADPRVVGGPHGTALNAAAFRRLRDVASLIIERWPTTTTTGSADADRSAPRKHGTPLQAALRGLVDRPHEQDEPIDSLLDILYRHDSYLGACEGPSRRSLLHMAARARCPAAVEWLLAHGLPASTVDAVGRRPMHIAIHAGDWEVTRLLQKGDTRLHTSDYQGRGGQHYAAVSESPQLVEAMSPITFFKNNVGPPEDAAAPRPDLLREAVKRLTSIYFTAPDADGWTPLHWACRKRDNLVVISYLLDNGADVRARTESGWTPRHVAIFHDNGGDETLRLLGKSDTDTDTDTNADDDDSDEGSDLPKEPGAAHSVSCEACFCPIYGERYRCTKEACGDFNLCFKCAKHVDRIHPRGHLIVSEGEWVEVTQGETK
ncbi:hypothetical protein RB598_003024 [Gaeumannomyces tritici]